MNTQRIGDDTLPNGYRVSTVRLNSMAKAMDSLLDQFTGRPDLPFESMVFHHATNGWTDLGCRRYGSEEEARAGHAELLAEWSTKTPPVRAAQTAEA